MKLIIIALLLVISGLNAQSQSLSPEVITTVGDYFTNSYASLSITIGELATETVSNSNNILTQGFQQSQYFTVDIEENKKNGFAVTVFPNPTNDILNIDIKTEQNLNTRIQLCDENGKILIDENIKVLETSRKYDLKIFAAGLYFLKIKTDNDYSKTVKIIKR
ncbi:MAG: hypothetical protein A2275_01480 [Bacteroidetes bacterium RIFOXYA12_FULL_35_11]|nr:MAG: hypothetical protein A2X01_18240 [Bacteroidetes bacterium GWF2_35_48]OFY75152.1 MAG: hypothetical protein A2275_01480 [Bacteroidetes bacterium RIFOXYA12_FULL_35_11]HBX49740.1 hypothetical protein [Bacteroidales bacterium]